MSDGASRGIMDTLKESTAEQHRDAERRQLQRALVGGRLPAATYAAWLGQMYLLHDALREEMSRDRPGAPMLAHVVRDDGCHVANLRADLALLGADSDQLTPLPATGHAIDEIRHASSANPPALLGYNYVLEGSMNGNRFIARAIARSMDPAAVSYLDPYGDEQHANWAAYRERMSSAGFSAEQSDGIVAAARRMFTAIARMSDELMER